MPVSNSTSLSPMFTIGEFCSSTMLSGGRKLSVSIFLISSSEAPVKVPLGGPSGSGPSETTVTSAAAEHRSGGNRATALPSLGARASALPPSRVGGAEAGAERKQGSSRNMGCHACFLH